MAASFVRAHSSVLWQAYVGALERRPLLTKIATGVIGTVLGDGMAQHTARHMREADERRRRSAQQAGAAAAGAPSPSTLPQSCSSSSPSWRYDFARTCRLCAYSALVGTPIAHYWFGLLDRGVLLPAAARASAGLGAACKTLLDQLLMAPAGLSLFFASVALMEGKGLGEAIGSAAARLKPALAANYALWPGAQAVNFALVPPRQRVLYVNVIAVFWTAVLSHLASSDVDGDADGGGVSGAGVARTAGDGGAGIGGGGAQLAAAAAGAALGPEAGEAAARALHHRRRHHLPLPVPPEPPAAEAGGGARRRGGGSAGRAAAQQQKQQQKQQAASDDDPPPDTFVPVVP